jgi:hypothetical protein
MKLSDVRKQLHTLQVENLTGAQIESAAGEMYLSLDALVSQHDAQDIVKTFRAVKTPTYGQVIPGSFEIVEKVMDDGIINLLGASISANKTYSIQGVSASANGGGVNIALGYFDGSTFVKCSEITLGDGVTGAFDLQKFGGYFDSTVYPVGLVTSGTASHATVQFCFAEVVQ